MKKSFVSLLQQQVEDSYILVFHFLFASKMFNSRLTLSFSSRADTRRITCCTVSLQSLFNDDFLDMLLLHWLGKETTKAGPPTAPLSKLLYCQSDPTNRSDNETRNARSSKLSKFQARLKALIFGSASSAFLRVVPSASPDHHICIYEIHAESFSLTRETC